jgi:hypothetical protein
MNEVVIPLKLSGIAALKAELRSLKDQMADAANPEAFAALADRAGEAQKQINKVNGAINDFKKGSNLDQARASFDGLSQSIMNMDFTSAAKQSANLKQTLGSLTPADLTKQFTGFISTLKNVGGAFVKLGMTILVNPIFLITAAVVAIIAVIALVLKSFGVLDDVMKAMMAPINALIAGFKELTDWLGLTTFAAEDNAAKTLEANEKVKKSSEERTAIVTADLGREIAELKAAGKDTTKLEEERSNVQIKEANNRKKTAIDAIEGQKALGDKADKEKLAELRKQVIAENEIIKQGYSDKIVAKNAADKKEADDAEKKQKEAEAKAKEAREKRIAADKASEAEIAAARKIVTDSAKSAQQVEIDDLKAAYKIKIETAQKFKNDSTALVDAQKIQEKAITDKYEAIEADRKEKKKEADAKALKDTLAFEDAKYLELVRLRDGQFEADKLKLQQEFDEKTAELKDGDELFLLLRKEFQDKINEIDTAAVEKVKSDEAKKRAEQFATIQKGFEFAEKTLGAIEGITNLAQANKLKGVEKGSKEEEKILRKQFQINKSMQLAGAIIDAGKAITASLASSPIAIGPVPNPAGIASLAFAAVTSATNIAKIAATQFTSSTTPSTDTPPPSTTAVAPASGPQLFGQANTGSQINAAGSSGQNITVTAVVSETEMTATQHFINNIQQNSVL